MSQRPSDVLSSLEITLVCPSNRRAGRAGAPSCSADAFLAPVFSGFSGSRSGFSGRSQTRISPRLLPAASRRELPIKLTAETQSASQGSVQASVALSKVIVHSPARNRSEALVLTLDVAALMRHVPA